MAELEIVKIEADREIEALKIIAAETEAELAALKERLDRKERDGLQRSRTAVGEISERKYVKYRQALNLVCLEAGIAPPDWIKRIGDADVVHIEREELVDRYVRSDGGIAPHLGPGEREALADRLRVLIRGAAVPSVNSEILFAKAPGWSSQGAHDLAAKFRSESGLMIERAIQISDRAMIASTSWSLSKEVNEWLEDSALRLMERVRPIDAGNKDRNAKAGSVIENNIKGALNRPSPQIENLRLLDEAMALFSTPGAMAQAYRLGLGDQERQFCRAWFAANRDFAFELGHRTGSIAAFSQVVADANAFRAKHYGSAPNFAQYSQNWAGEAGKIVFRKERPSELIQEARHALVDTTMLSALVSMPKIRNRFLNLGAWEGNEVIHQSTIDVGDLTNNAFLIEARDAAEIELMQGTNPLAMTAGLVTWVSADDKKREAPLFTALADFDEEAQTVIRKAPFLLNRSLFRRIEADHPLADKRASIFDGLQDVAFGPKLGEIFARVTAAVAARTPGRAPILEIKDICLVGSFDSSRAVLERRLDLKVFPALVDNPVVRLLAEGSSEPLVLGDYTPQGGRSPPDEIQRLAVKAVLGGTSFVLEGPPGTGKTATIVSMLEALNAAGKRVLVSAAMPGAIEVIGRRIDRGFRFSISSMREKEIDIGSESRKVDFKDLKGNIFLGTPMALIKDMPSDFTFDVLIVDEGSQLRLSHALALVGHVKQIVIAGDSRQLQPQEGRDGSTSEMSLLKRAREAGFPVVMLESHYRSLHPSLIAWSNTFSYGSKLKPKRGPWLFGDAGFDVNYIDTGRRLSHGDDKLNVEEAEAIAAEVLRWAKDGRRSVGVVALTQAQRDLIRKVVDRVLTEAGISMRERHAQEKALEASEGPKRPIGFFSSKEPFFIRTAGAIQGEERDVVLISLGVGPDEKGKINQSTGLLGRPDALALVNVMLSRARLRTAVFSSIMPWQINMATMTPGMFLVASILRMGTVVGMPEILVDDVDTMLLSDEWSVDKFFVGKDEIRAIRLPHVTDKYALAVGFWGKNHEPCLALAELERSGWQVTTENRPPTKEREVVLRAIVRRELMSLGHLNAE